MRFRLLPLGLLLAVCAFAGTTGPTPAPWKPKHPAAPVAPAGIPGKVPTMTINGVPDTGQFLPDTSWLVRVAGRVTTVGDFVRQYNAAYPPDRPGQDSLGRVAFLQIIINHDVLGLTARGLNLTLDFTDRATMRETEERALSDVYFQRMVLDSVHVADAEVDQVAQQLGIEARFRHAVFADRAGAERARQGLLSGKLKWHDVAVRQGPASGDLGPDGDLGWVQRAKIDMDHAVPMFRIGVGGTTEVFRTSAGYEVAQMLEQRKIPAPSVRLLRNSVRRNMRDYYAGIRSDRIQDQIGRRIGIAYDTASVNFLASHFKPPMQVSEGATGSTVEINQEVPELSPDDTSRVLATWQGGGRFSIGQFMHWFMSMSPLMRPNVSFPDAVTAQVKSLVMEPYRAVDARQIGLDRDPLVVSRVENKREQLLVERMYQDSVASKVSVSREERLAYYNEHKRDFVTYAAVDFAAIYRHNKAGADSLLQAIKAGAKAADILAADSLRGEQTGAMHHQVASEKGSFYKILFEELRPGQATVVGPDRSGVFVVIQLLAFDPGHQLSFEESQGYVDESLQNLNSEKLLNALLDRLRKRYTIAWRPEQVMLIRLLEMHD